MGLPEVLAAWSRMEMQLDDFLFDPAGREDFEALRTAGIAVPAPLRSLYEAHDGGSIFAGNLRLYPLRAALDGDFTVLNLSNRLREWEWPVPPEMLVFAGNGQDEFFGTWAMPASGLHPVVEIGAIFEEDALAVAATSLAAFLTGWSAYYLLLHEAETTVLDVLGLPDDLRFHPDALDGVAEARIWQWADPALPARWTRSPYDDRLTADEINRWLRDAAADS